MNFLLLVYKHIISLSWIIRHGFFNIGLQAYYFFILDYKAWIFYYWFTSKNFFKWDLKQKAERIRHYKQTA